MNQSQINYIKNNPEKIKESNRKYYLNHRLEIIKNVQDYRNKNSKQISKRKKLYNKLYQKNNPEIMLQKSIRHLEKLGKELNLDGKAFGYALWNWSRVIRKKYKTCQICGAPVDFVHHIFHKAKYPKLSLNLNNGIALCKQHHREVHGAFR